MCDFAHNFSIFLLISTSFSLIIYTIEITHNNNFKKKKEREVGKTMGYSTDYYGSFKIEPALSAEEVEKLNAWLTCRHTQLDMKKIRMIDAEADEHTIDGKRLGQNGWNWIKSFVDSDGDKWEPIRELVIDYNECSPLPSLWSDLEVNIDAAGDTWLSWNGSEKTYCMKEWLQLLIDVVFAPNGYKLNGRFDWEGEDRFDVGAIIIEDNNITIGEHYYY